MFKTKHWQDPVNLLLGLWTLVSPWVLAYQTETQPMWNSVVIGLLIAVMAVTELVDLMAWEEWSNVALGIWLLISPWVLGFSALHVAMWNAVVIGIVVAGLALWVLATDKDIGGWWHPAT